MHLEIESFTNRLNAIDWGSYRTAYGKAVNVASQLLTLVSGEDEASLDASHELWCGLCHQRAYVSSASVPAFPFLLEALHHCGTTLRTELLDIFAGFVECTNPARSDANGDFQRQLRSLLMAELPYFRTLVGSEGEHGFAERIVEDLSKCARAAR